METENKQNPEVEETEVQQVEETKEVKGAIIFFIMSAIFLCIGFYKLWAYDRDMYDSVNVYVGGDAYNYIINSNLATAYFTVAILFSIIALGFLIIGRLGKISK